MFVSFPKYARRNAIEHDVVFVNTRTVFMYMLLPASRLSKFAIRCSSCPLMGLHNARRNAAKTMERCDRFDSMPKALLGALRTSTNFLQLAMLKILIKTGRFEVSTRIVSDEELRRPLRAGSTD